MKLGLLKEYLSGLQQQGRLPHAFSLLHGQESLLSHSATEISALLLCESAKKSSVCMQCTSCSKIFSQQHPDVQTLKTDDKEIKLENLKSWIKWLQLRPNEAKLKIGIINQSYKFNLSAANALLKTLEEPPPHVLIILLAQSKEQLLPTVSSRLLHIRLTENSNQQQLETMAPPSWAEDLNTFLNLDRDFSLKEAFEFSQSVAKDKDYLPYFFKQLEQKLREHMVDALSYRHFLKLEELFSQCLKYERNILNRYGNAGLAIDHLLLTWKEIGEEPA